MYRSLAALVVLLVASFPAKSYAAEPLPRAVLHLDEFPAALFRPDSSDIARVFPETSKSVSPMVSSEEKLGFDRQELQRWSVAESRLPAGGEIRLRQAGFWEQYRWQVLLIALAFLIETILIIALLYADHRRRKAEADGRMLLSELAHLNRIATAGALSSSIAHEIRQPLGAMVASGNAGLNWLKRNPPELDEVRTVLRNIVDQGHRVDEIIKNISALFKKQELPRLPTNMNDIVQQVLTFAARSISSKGVRCACKMATPAPVVSGDAVQLQQVLLNLVLNSVEAMDSSASDARFLHVSTEINGADCVIAVADSGPGIDPKHMDDLFRPFFTTKSGGMGLGLSICKSIVEAHGGRLTAVARARHGLVFRIVLPLLGSENDANATIATASHGKLNRQVPANHNS